VGHGGGRRPAHQRAALAAAVHGRLHPRRPAAVFADRGTAGEPEDVVLRDRALALIGLVWVAMYGLAVANW
jgi:hypothetical protein